MTKPLTDAPTVSRETFDGAVFTGDLVTIDAFFAQPHVRREVESTNAYIIETAPTDDASKFTLRDGSLPWFRLSRNSSSDMDTVPLLGAARRGHLHVIQWFYSNERATLMGATLALLLPLVARYDSKHGWYQKHWTDDPAILETLLSSLVFSDYVDDDRKQSMLDLIASECHTFRLINVTIAHGTRVNAILARIARLGVNDYVAELEEAGALLVGAELLQPPFMYGQYEHAQSFLAHGVDWGPGPARLLNDAAAFGDARAVGSLLARGFVDADARNGLGMTALMQVALVNPSIDLSPHLEDPTPDIAEWLLELCDINLTDDHGCTALHYAVKENYDVADVLLSRGADVTIRDKEGRLALPPGGIETFRSQRKQSSELYRRYGYMAQ